MKKETIYGIIAGVAWLMMLGTVGAMENDMVDYTTAAIRLSGCMVAMVIGCVKGGVIE